MSRKCLFVLLIATVTIGVAFTQEKAKNTIVVDIGPTIMSLSMVDFAKSQIEGDGFEPTGFGIGVQYERQINNHFAVAGRAAYFGFGMQYSKTQDSVTARTGVDLYAITVEAHARYYPFGGAFFLCGILGYTNMGMNASGKILAEVEGVTESVSANYNISRDFIKFGAKLGWRIRFGNNSGFTFEPSLGWDFGFSSSDTFGTQLAKKVEDENPDAESQSDFDEAFKLIEDFLFVGGPRVTLSFGWSF